MSSTVNSLPSKGGTSPRPPVEGEEIKHHSKFSLVQDCNYGVDCVKNNDIYDKSQTLLMDIGDFDHEICRNNQVSADCSPPSTEQGTPPYFKWAQNLHNLLKDIEGVELFQQYLKQEKYDTRSLDFWFACEGVKKADPKNKHYIQQMIKLINKNYVRALKEISIETRNEISNKIASKVGMDQTIFNIAQHEVEAVIRKTTYPNFLKSDLYLHHIQVMQNNTICDSPRLDEVSVISENGSNTSREGLDILPTLPEESELQIVTCARIPLTRDVLLQRNRLSEVSLRIRPEAQAGHYLKSPNRSYNACHVKYSSFLPASAQDSELQSLSSDAQTDDTMSLTDSIGECAPTFRSKSEKKRHRAAKYGAVVNRDCLSHNTFIPRTQRMPQECKERLSPAQFANILTEKLNKYKKEVELRDKFADRLSKIEDDKSIAKGCDENQPHVGHVADHSIQLSSSAVKERLGITEESDQAILDQHVSRVWEDSAHQTPSRSPGHYSPPIQPYTPPLDRRRCTPCVGENFVSPNLQTVTSGTYNTLSCGPQQFSHKVCRSAQYMMSHHGSSNSSRHKKDRDTYSSDSGTVRDFTPDNEPVHQTVCGYKNNHHYIGVSSGVADQYATMSSEHMQSKRTRDIQRRSSSKKTSMTDSSSSCVDSGVSVACEPIPLSLSARERVCNWLDNKKYSTFSHGTDSEKDSSTCHKKSSHSTTSPVLTRTSKKPVMYSSSRPGTLEPGSTPWPLPPSFTVPPGSNSHLHTRLSCGVQPSQPVAQDLSMPILPPPDTTTQLVEARRRLEDETRGKQAKQKASSCSREKAYHETSKVKSSVKTTELQEETCMHRKSSRRSCPGSVQGSNNSNTSSNDMTVIGYCFGSKSVPYLTKLPGKNITLKQFKSLLSKRGNYRYFFKRASDDFGTGVVFEEITDDNEVLPLWEGKIFAVIEQVE